MKNIPLMILAVSSLLPLGTSAVVLVDFDASQSVTSQTVMGISRFFQPDIPIISSQDKESYSGSPIYGAFYTAGEGLYGVSEKEGAGLKIRWNPKIGAPGEKLSGLFLFKKKDFLQGAGKQSVALVAGSDQVSVQIGYSNPGTYGAEHPVQSANFRFVLRDQNGWFISESLPIESKKSLLLKATTLAYFRYDPALDDAATSAGIGQSAQPSFQGIRFLGFRLEAERGANIAAGSNVGVTEFSVQGTLVESTQP